MKSINDLNEPPITKKYFWRLIIKRFFFLIISINLESLSIASVFVVGCQYKWPLFNFGLNYPSYISSLEYWNIFKIFLVVIAGLKLLKITCHNAMIQN